MWMPRHYPHLPFERFADDASCHGASEPQAQEFRAALARRFADCGVELHPQQTKIVYCTDDDRRGTSSDEKFDFLGYTFRPRRSKNRWGKYFVTFSPGVSPAAAKAMRQAMRQWQLRCRVDKQIDDLARMFNPIIRGWLTSYTRYDKSALYPTLQPLDRQLARWAMAKYKRLRRHRRRAEQWVRRVARRQPGLFAHWRLLHAGAGR
jgi:RNA-directed DNA polymerase